MAAAVSQQPQFYNFDAQAVRVVGTWDQPWFVAKDVCDALGLSNPTEAVRGLEDDEKGLRITETLGGPQQLVVVNESGLYALIFRSRKPHARLFRRWVTGTVLPTIRRTGAFAVRAPDRRQPELPPPGEGGPLAMLPGRMMPVPDLATEHTQWVLNEALGNAAAEWSGTLSDLAAIAVRDHKLHWVIRDQNDWRQRVSLGCFLRRRIGIDYCGFGRTRVHLNVVGRGRHRRFVITRREGFIGGEE